jgi:CRISPR-associated protein Cmr2
MNPKIGEVLHPKMQDDFAKLGGAATLDEVRRPVGPALHAAISEALTNFAIRITHGIVAKHRGELIYSGGDDLLALLPTQTAIACASELEKALIAPDGYWREAEQGRALLAGGPEPSAFPDT